MGFVADTVYRTLIIVNGGIYGDEHTLVQTCTASPRLCLRGAHRLVARPFCAGLNDGCRFTCWTGALGLDKPYSDLFLSTCGEFEEITAGCPFGVGGLWIDVEQRKHSLRH